MALLPQWPSGELVAREAEEVGEKKSWLRAPRCDTSEIDSGTEAPRIYQVLRNGLMSFDATERVVDVHGRHSSGL